MKRTLEQLVKGIVDVWSLLPRLCHGWRLAPPSCIAGTRAIGGTASSLGLAQRIIGVEACPSQRHRHSGHRVKLPEAECEQQARRARGEVPGAVGVVIGLVSYVFKAVACPASGRPCDSCSLRDAPAATALPDPWVRRDVSASSGSLGMAGVRGSTRRSSQADKVRRRHPLVFT